MANMETKYYYGFWIMQQPSFCLDVVEIGVWRLLHGTSDRHASPETRMQSSHVDSGQPSSICCLQILRQAKGDILRLALTFSKPNLMVTCTTDRAQFESRKDPRPSTAEAAASWRSSVV